jgi:hypothetical protein
MKVEIQWEDYRRLDQTLNLEVAFDSLLAKEGKLASPAQIDFLRTAQQIRPVRSRQVAALAIAMALRL